LSYAARRHLAQNKYDAVLTMGPSGLFLNDYIWRASGSPVPVMREQRRTAKMGLLSRTLISLDLSTQE
jgi:hypothetical protein